MSRDAAAQERDRAETELAAWGKLAVDVLGKAAMDMDDAQLREALRKHLFRN